MDSSAPFGGKVHPVAPEVQFPRYDFFRKHDPQLEQRQQLAVGLEACRRGRASRLGAMLYRTELSLSCRLQDEQPEVGSLLCFGMEHEQQGQMRPSAWLLIEQSTLYQLAAFFWVLPLFGDGYISPQVRLLFALMLSMVLMPLLPLGPAVAPFSFATAVLTLEQLLLLGHTCFVQGLGLAVLYLLMLGYQ